MGTCTSAPPVWSGAGSGSLLPAGPQPPRPDWTAGAGPPFSRPCPIAAATCGSCWPDWPPAGGLATASKRLRRVRCAAVRHKHCPPGCPARRPADLRLTTARRPSASRPAARGPPRQRARTARPSILFLLRRCRRCCRWPLFWPGPPSRRAGRRAGRAEKNRAVFRPSLHGLAGLGATIKRVVGAARKRSPSAARHRGRDATVGEGGGRV